MPLPASLQKSIDATKVDYVQLGTSGLRVSVPILGTMSMGSSEWMPWVISEEDALSTLKAAYDAGINTWDTANFYSNGLSESIIGKAIRQFDIPREKLVLLTKIGPYTAMEVGTFAPMFGTQMGLSKDYVNQGGLSRSAIFTAVEGSLARLGTSYIDVFQIARIDPTTPPEETLKALHDLVQAGKVRYIGASSMWATEFAQLQFIAEKNGWTKFVSMQNSYNLCYREEEREMIRFCNKTGVGIIPYGALFGGKLSRSLGDESSARAAFKHPLIPNSNAADSEIIHRVEEIANKKGYQMSHVALAWIRSKGAIPILGFNSVARVQESSELRGKSLTSEEITYLEEPYVAKPVRGHE